MRVQVDDARAVWRVLISPDGGHHSHVFDVEIGGQTYTLPLDVAGDLGSCLQSLVSSSRTYDALQATQAALAGD